MDYEQTIYRLVTEMRSRSGLKIEGADPIDLQEVSVFLERNPQIAEMMQTVEVESLSAVSAGQVFLAMRRFRQIQTIVSSRQTYLASAHA